MSFDINWGSLVHIAALFQIVGFLIVDQLMLRLFILIGTLCYLVYYIAAFNTPLWEAFFWSSIMGTANCIVIVKLVLDRTTLNLSERDKDLYKAFQEMTPGEFRKLLKVGQWRNGEDQDTLTIQDRVPEKLYYVQQGDIHVSKDGARFDLEEGAFIGEVAFFLDTQASATVTVAEQTSYFEWSRDSLDALLKKNPGIRAAIYSKLTRDMAKKVAESVRPSAAA